MLWPVADVCVNKNDWGLLLLLPTGCKTRATIKMVLVQANSHARQRGDSSTHERCHYGGCIIILVVLGYGVWFVIGLDMSSLWMMSVSPLARSNWLCFGVVGGWG